MAEEDMHEFDGRLFEMKDHSKPEPNVIRSVNSDNEDNEETLHQHPGMQRQSLGYEPTEEFKNYLQDSRLVEIDSDAFGVTIKSKKDLYLTLSVELQLYLPSIDTCTQQFLMDVCDGTKNAFHNSEVKQVTVPRLEEFNGKEIFTMAMNNPQMRKYLLEPTDDDKEGARTVSCKYLYAGKFCFDSLPTTKQFLTPCSREHRHARVFPTSNQAGSREAQEQGAEVRRRQQVQDPQRHLRGAPQLGARVERLVNFCLIEHLESKNKTLNFRPRKRTTGQFLRDNPDVAAASN